KAHLASVTVSISIRRLLQTVSAQTPPARLTQTIANPCARRIRSCRSHDECEQLHALNSNSRASRRYLREHDAWMECLRVRHPAKPALAVASSQGRHGNAACRSMDDQDDCAPLSRS